MQPPRRLALVIAWTGAAIFAASLAWFVYCYLFRFGQPAPAGPLARPLLTNALLFSAFALHHSVLARSGAKRLMHQIAPPELERSIYTWVASILFLVVCAQWQPVPGVIYELTGLWRFLGWTVQVAGLALTIRASAALDVLDLAGVRAVARPRERARPRAFDPAPHHPRTVRVRPPPAVFRLDAVRVRRTVDDRHTRRVRDHQHRVPDDGHSVGGTGARRHLRPGIPGVPPQGQDPDDSLGLLSGGRKFEV